MKRAVPVVLVVVLAGCGPDSAYERNGWGAAVRKTLSDLREALPESLRVAVEAMEPAPAPAAGEDTANGGDPGPAPVDGPDTAKTVDTDAASAAGADRATGEACEKAMEKAGKALIESERQQATIEAFRLAGAELARAGGDMGRAEAGAVGPSVRTARDRIDSAVSGLATSARVLVISTVFESIEAGWKLAQLPECDPELFDPARLRL